MSFDLLSPCMVLCFLLVGGGGKKFLACKFVMACSLHSYVCRVYWSRISCLSICSVSRGLCPGPYLSGTWRTQTMSIYSIVFGTHLTKMEFSLLC